MKKKSHILLGRYLNDMQAFVKPLYEKAFLFGCVEPDYNYFTYIKGALTEGALRGHNFKKAQQNLLRTIEKLEKEKHLTILRYYRLGKLIHYIADAFTSPHNESYSAAGHRTYEIRLHSELVKDIADSFEMSQTILGGSVMEYLISIHEQYRSAWKSTYTDVQFILEATGVVFNQLVPQVMLAQ